MSDAGDTHAPPTAAVDPHAFPPKPPIWRGADQSRVCARRVVLGGTAALVLFGAWDQELLLDHALGDR